MSPLTDYSQTDGTGRVVFIFTMSKETFLFPLNALRRDDTPDRADRVKHDPAAAISKVFATFIENCQRCYTIEAYGCADEMLVALRGRSKFRDVYAKQTGQIVHQSNGFNGRKNKLSFQLVYLYW